MQTPLKSWQRWLVLGILMLVLTACSTKVTRPPVEAPTDSGGHWNDTDSRVTAEAMIKDALKRPWAQRFTQVTGRGPVVTVGTVLNRTHEPLNTQTFVQDLEQALMDSGQVQFVADTVKPAGQELLYWSGVPIPLDPLLVPPHSAYHPWANFLGCG